MEGTYCVYLGKQPSGKVLVSLEGLYYRFRCRCQLSGEVICRLIVNCGTQKEILGVLVPMDKGFGLDTKLPVKRFASEKPEFSLLPKTVSEEGTFVPIYPDEPFAYIENLKELFLVRKYGQSGIVIK